MTDRISPSKPVERQQHTGSTPAPTSGVGAGSSYHFATSSTVAGTTGAGGGIGTLHVPTPSAGDHAAGNSGGGSGGGDQSSSTSSSPLEKLLHDLRREHGAAAGVSGLAAAATATATVGTGPFDLGDGEEAASDRFHFPVGLGAAPSMPSFETMRQRRYHSSASIAIDRRASSRASSLAMETNLQRNNSLAGTRRGMGNVLRAESSSVSSNQQQQRTFSLDRDQPQTLHLSASQRSPPARRSSNVSTALYHDVPTTHAENLLSTTPHLRYLCPASRDMDGLSAPRRGANLFGLPMPAGFGRGGAGGAVVSSQSACGGPGGGTSSSSPRGNAHHQAASSTAGDRDRRAAAELAAFVRVLAHEMSLDEFAQVESDLFTSVFALVHSTTDNARRLAGVAALDALLTVPSSDEEKKAIKFANNLSHGLRSSGGDYDFLSALSRTLGRMTSGSANVDYVEFEVTRALEWLRSAERADRRLAATLTLRELARCAPTTFMAKTRQASHGVTNEFIDQIFPALGDPQPVVRACAADALAETLRYLVQRRHRSTTVILCQVYGSMMDGFRGRTGGTGVVGVGVGGGGGSGGGGVGSPPPSNPTPPAGLAPSSADARSASYALHGSLLVLGTMLDHTGSFMLPRYDEVCIEVSRLVGHPRALIRLEVVRLCPKLARHCPSVFVRRYLDTLLDFLIRSGRSGGPSGGGGGVPSGGKGRSRRGAYSRGVGGSVGGGAGGGGIDLRPSSFLAIGQLALAIADSGGVLPRLDEIFRLVRGGLLVVGASPPSSSAGTAAAAAARGGDGANAGGGETSSLTREALRCGAYLVEALGELSTPYVSDLVNNMFNAGLSEDLINSLQGLAISLPSEQARIKRRLLREISICLAGVPLACVMPDPFDDQYGVERSSLFPTTNSVHGGRRDSAAVAGAGLNAARYSSRPSVAQDVAHLPSPTRTSAVSRRKESLGGRSVPAGSRTFSSGENLGGSAMAEADSSGRISVTMSEDAAIVKKVVLSLRTLGAIGHYDREGVPDAGPGEVASSCLTMLPFLRDVITKYLSHPCVEVRWESALACCLLLLPRSRCREEGEPSSPAARRWDEDDSPSASGNEVQRPSSATAALFSSASASAIIIQHLGSTSGRIVEEVLEMLTKVAVSDPSPLVRMCVVRSLDRRYDPFLCQAHHLPPLLLLLQDENVNVRAAALQLLGRLARINPAPILPKLRRVLKMTIIDLRCGGDTGGGKEAATRILVVFLRSQALHRIVHPLLPSIISSLPLRGPPRLASAGVEALGELALVARSSMTPWLGTLIPQLLETEDQSSANKQRTSFRALGQIAGSTGYVISPYLDYPQLLPRLVAVLPGTKRSPWSLRREVIRTFGILGALDPQRYHAVAHKSPKSGGGGGGCGYFVDNEEGEGSNVSEGEISGLVPLSASVARSAVGGPPTATMLGSSQRQPNNAAGYPETGNDDDDEPAHFYMYGQYAMTAQPISKLVPPVRLDPSKDDFYPTVAVQALTRILKDPSLAVHHGMAMQAIMFTFNALGLRCVPFLKRIVPYILHTVRTCAQASLKEALLKQIASLSGIVKDHLRPYIASIFEVVEEFWSSRHMAIVLNLVEQMATAVPDDFLLYLPRLIPLILASLEAPRVSEWGARIDTGVATSEADQLELVLRSIRCLRGILNDFLHLLVPSLVKLVDSLISTNVAEATCAGIQQDVGSRLSSIAVTTIATLSVLLQSAGEDEVSDTSPSGISTTGNGSLPVVAQAAQPLMRILGREPYPNKAIGLALVDCLCVCARQLGRAQWMPLYHVAARSSICHWQRRVEQLHQSSSSARTGLTMEVTWRASGGLSLYDSVVKDLLERQVSPGPWPGLADSSSVFPSGNGYFSANDGQLAGFLDGGENQRRLGVGSALNSEHYSGRQRGRHGSFENSTEPSIQPVVNQPSQLRVNQIILQRTWDVSQRTTREEWDEWMRRFAVQLLREAPNPALRASAGLANAYQPLSRELFSAAFICCWAELSDQYRQNLVQSLEVAFMANISPEILQTLLNLAEFMERDGIEGGLPIDISVLAELALKCRAYAKALHYKEREFIAGGGASCVEALITINKKLDLPEAALGVLKVAQQEVERSRIADMWNSYSYPPVPGNVHHGIIQQPYGTHKVAVLSMPYGGLTSANTAGIDAAWEGMEVLQDAWLAKLGSWSEALAMYERRLKDNPSDVGTIVGCMRCLDARGEWRRVLELARESWSILADESDVLEGLSIAENSSPNDMLNVSRDHRKAIKFCAQAAWRLGQWDELETYASQLVRGKGIAAGTVLSGNGSGAAGGVVGSGDGVTPIVDFDGAFYSAILHIHREQWAVAADAIDAARRAMDSRFTALMSESYKRAYPSMVTTQVLAEMEEIIEFRRLEASAKTEAHRHPANRADIHEARQHLLSVWRSRLAGCRVDGEVHSSILAVRSLVLGPTEEVEATLTLSSLLRESNFFKFSERVLLDPLQQLGADLDGPVFGFGVPHGLGLGLKNRTLSLNIDRLVTDEGVPTPKFGNSHEQYSRRIIRDAGGMDRLNIQHRIYYAYVKLLWTSERRDEAMDRISRLCDIVDLVATCENSGNGTLRAACWLKMGDWKLEQATTPGSSLKETLQIEVLSAYKKATASTQHDYKAWHKWALMNFRIAQQSAETLSQRSDVVAGYGSAAAMRSQSIPSSSSIRNHVIAAVTGFVRAISLGTKRWSASVQQDMLNLLTCLFKYGDLPDVAATISDGLISVTLEAWLGVLPQLLARIHIKTPAIRSTLHLLLIRLGAKHPQALMYPLSVLLKSPVPERKAAAESLMNSLKEQSSALVDEALMVSSELIRVAILWLELWHEGLEDASRLYFGEGNVSAMLDVLVPLHEQLEQGPTTRIEHDFSKSFGRDLADAHNFLKEYVRLTTSTGGTIPTQGGFLPNGNQPADSSGRPPAPSSSRQSAEAEDALNQAWDLYYTVFRRINKQLPGLTTLELGNCSPQLKQAKSLELGIPGTYRVDGSYVRIEKINDTIQVITTKQRPRKIVIRGSNGRDYVFLLKGHEDLRQDERVMQLFGLVNALLAKDRRTNKHDLDIQRYAIAPLSHDVGLVGWVPHCDTLHSLIRDYRESKKIVLNAENREMMKMAPDYDLLTVMQKVEVFETALERTVGKGNDLYEILWIKSSNSEEWLERRTKYTRSLAVMSMVGYILGLGDRHPSNLMLDQISGRVLHVDFGDCFEVAMHREKFPETIPFRLTRMLVRAMEVSGIEGSYRSTCERTMGVLRDNRDSLIAMLEAFVYDPLISWRLLEQTSNEEKDEEFVSVPDALHDIPHYDSQVEIANDSNRDSSTAHGIEDGSRLTVSNQRGILHGPITECQDEDKEDDEPEGSEVINLIGGGGGLEEGRLSSSNDRNGASGDLPSSRVRSLQMYSNIQNMAANLSTSSRIASITAGEAERVAAEGSVARSRLDRSVRQREVLSLLGGEEAAANEEALNEKALKVIRRVQDKLTGTDFSGPDGLTEPLDVQDQVDRLIVQATSTENLCQLFIGWCAFW